MNATVPAADPVRAQRRAESLLLGGLLGLGALALAVFALLWHGRAVEVPHLGGGDTALAEALQWPWQGFPSVQPVEQETIRRDFRLGEPLLARELRPYLALPEVLRPGTPAARREVEEALAALAPFANGTPGAAPADKDAGAPAPGADAALAALSRVANKQPIWIVLYDRGWLSLNQGNAAAAVGDLRAAMQRLLPRLQSLPAAAAARADLLEAAVHTDYALGLALLAGTPADPARRAEAVRALREAVRLLQPLWETHVGDYGGVSHPLAFFHLRPTGLSTAALTNDLVAAYLASPDFHDCAEVPSGLPCGRVSRKGSCIYRDRVFCLSLQRAGGPFAASFVALAHRFYAGELAAWNEEYRLWALSNAVDRASQSLALAGDPRLLYNLGSLLLELGAMAPAADLLDQSADELGRSPNLSDAELERIERLATVARVLAGLEPQEAPRTAPNDERQVSALRALYRKLYGGGGAKEFPAVGRSFTPDAEATLDGWLFVRAWRQLLERGDFDGFEREYLRLMAERDVPRRDFFRRWHAEVTEQLGQRALARAEVLAQAGEVDEARRIRLFLADSGSFPPAVVAAARSGWGWTWRRLWLWLRVAAIVVVLLAALVVGSGLVNAHRNLFQSAYRAGRLRAQSPSAPPDPVALAGVTPAVPHPEHD